MSDSSKRNCSNYSTSNKRLRGNYTNGRNYSGFKNLKDSLHGNVYQLKLLMLFLTRASHLKYKFSLDTELSDAKKFDDLVFSYKPEGGKRFKYRFLQAKHKLNIHQSYLITASDLLTADWKEQFCLQKYFDSYKKIKRIAKFNSNETEIQDFIIFTNNTFDDEVKKVIGCTLFEPIDDPILKFKETDNAPLYYKFNMNKKSKLYETLKRTYGHQLNKNIDDEIKEFLDKLVFAVNQPNEIELGAIIKKELGTGFIIGLCDLELVYNTLLSKMLDWFKEKGNRTLSDEDARAMFKEIESHLNNLMLSERILMFREIIGINGINFKSEFLEVVNFLKDSNKQILHIETHEDTFLSSIKVYQTIVNSGLYNEIESCMFVSLATLGSLKETKGSIMEAFHSKGCYNLLVLEVHDDCLEADFEEFFTKLFNIKSPDKRIIIINRIKIDIFKYFPLSLNYGTVKDSCGFSELSLESQKKLLQNMVEFQSQMIPLNKLIDENAMDWPVPIVDSVSLVKLLKGESLTFGGSQTADLATEVIKLYEGISINKLSDCFETSESTLFMISGVDQAETEVMKNQFIRILKECLLPDKIKNCDAIRDQIGFIPSDAEGRRILISTNHNRESNINNFNQLCNKAPNKVIYWIEITQHNFIIGKLLYLYNPYSFIKRQLQNKAIIDRSIIDELSKQDPTELYLFSNIQSEYEFTNLYDFLNTSGNPSNETRKQLQKNMENNHVRWCFSEEEAEINFKEMIRSGKSVHWIIVENTELIWKRSFGTLQSLYHYKDKDVRESLLLDQDSFISNLNEKVVIIADKPGQGKTTVLRKVAKMTQKSNWVIFIDLKNCYDAISELPNTEDLSIGVVLKFICAASIDCFNNSLPKNLFKFYLLNKTASYPPLILFDSFDEIRGSSTKDTSECQAKVLTLLIFLKDKTTATLFVTTRLEGEQVLENKLLVFATKLKEFEDHEQLEYLKNFWLVSSSLTVSQKDFETKLENFAEELINNEILMKHRDFMGVALQLRMVAETFWQDLRFLFESESLKISSNDILGNISKLYHKFIERKYDIYLTGKLDLTAKFPSQESKILRLL